MRKLLILFILFLLYSNIEHMYAQTILLQDSLFFATILQSKRDNSYYLAFNIKATDYQGRVVIENLMMYRFLLLTQNMGWSRYEQFMRNILLNDDTLVIEGAIDERSKDGRTKKWAFQKVKPIEEVQRQALLGEEEFINYFFIQEELIGVIKDSIYLDRDNENCYYLNNAIINQLFEWRIYTCRQGYTGNLIYLTAKRADQVQQQWINHDTNK